MCASSKNGEMGSFRPDLDSVFWLKSNFYHNSYPDLHHLQEGMKFATQISPILNYQCYQIEVHYRMKCLGSLINECYGFIFTRGIATACSNCTAMLNAVLLCLFECMD